MNGETYEVRQFLTLYKSYEMMLRERGTDYRAEEEKADGLARDRMTIMRQMRNYLSHKEDPGFIAVSKECLQVLEKMVKEESLKGDTVKEHLVTPAKGSLKEGTMISAAIHRLSVLAMLGTFELPVYDPDTKLLKGIVTLERLTYEMMKKGDMPISEKACGPYGKSFHLLKPTDPCPKEFDNRYYCCTKDGTTKSQYMGYLDR